MYVLPRRGKVGRLLTRVSLLRNYSQWRRPCDITGLKNTLGKTVAACCCRIRSIIGLSLQFGKLLTLGACKSVLKHSMTTTISFLGCLSFRLWCFRAFRRPAIPTIARGHGPGRAATAPWCNCQNL